VVIRKVLRSWVGKDGTPFALLDIFDGFLALLANDPVMAFEKQFFFLLLLLDLLSTRFVLEKRNNQLST